MSRSHKIVDSLESNSGIGPIASGSRDFESALLDQIHPWLESESESESPPVPVVACGMIGSQNGWVETPYHAAPCSPVTDSIPVHTKSPLISLSIISGIKQLTPPDIMRGEETQIAGFLASSPNFEGWICLPGTHSKWARIAQGKIQQFQTFMTGEVFNLLATQSLLKFTTAHKGWDPSAFQSGLDLAAESPQNLLSHAFQLRPDAILNHLSPVASRSKLSGILIGHECHAAISYLSQITPKSPICLIGNPKICHIYQQSIKAHKHTSTISHSHTTTPAGLAHYLHPHK